MAGPIRGAHSALSAAPFPFVNCVAHRLFGAVLEPRHEGAVELEVSATLHAEKSARVLGVPVRCRNGRSARNRVAMPIEAHSINIRPTLPKGATPSIQKGPVGMERGQYLPLVWRGEPELH